MSTGYAAVIGFVIGCVVAAGTAVVYASNGPFVALLTFSAAVAAISFGWYLARHPRLAVWLIAAVVIATAGWFGWGAVAGIGWGAVSGSGLEAVSTTGRWGRVLDASGRSLEALSTIRMLLVVIAILLLIIAQRLARISKSGRH